MSPIKNSTTFFAYARRSPFGGRLSQDQVDGINAILKAWDYYGLTDRRWLACILANVFHETGGRMVPVRETFASTDAGAKAALEKAWKEGRLPTVKTPYWRGNLFGRGQIQITHEKNYRKLGQRLGVDLVARPELALDLDISAKIVVVGMAEGLFTGKRLDDYFSATADDPVGSRAIVNGTDKAKLIATYYKAFLDAIEASSVPGGPSDVTPEMAAADDVKPTESGSALTLLTGLGWSAIASALLGVNNPWAFGVAAMIVASGAFGGYMLLTGRWSIRRGSAIA
jgi:predicted chitinase